MDQVEGDGRYYLDVKRSAVTEEKLRLLDKLLSVGEGWMLHHWTRLWIWWLEEAEWQTLENIGVAPNEGDMFRVKMFDARATDPEIVDIMKILAGFAINPHQNMVYFKKCEDPCATERRTDEVSTSCIKALGGRAQ
eukprot:s223_g7.t1